MKIRTFFFALLTFAFAGQISAQCSSSAKATNVALHEQADIIGIATSVDDFSTLVTAVKAAGLVATLQSEGPFTVFAPTNDAFAKLPAGTVESLVKPENKDQLTKILTYHVIAGEFMAADVIKAIKNAPYGTFKIETVSGNMLKAMIKDGNVVLKDENGNMSTVIKTDVDASNGVVHVIDTVVLPK